MIHVIITGADGLLGSRLVDNFKKDSKINVIPSFYPDIDICVYKSVEMVVNWGLKHRDLSNILAIGIDEIAHGIGHVYNTLVYQIDEGMKRLLWIGEGRSAKTLLKFFNEFGKERTMKIKYVCSDMWKPYLKVIKKKATNAINILDRFHIMQNINKKIDIATTNGIYKTKLGSVNPQILSLVEDKSDMGNLDMDTNGKSELDKLINLARSKYQNLFDSRTLGVNYLKISIQIV